MSDSKIAYVVENRVAVVTIDNPPMNALNRDLYLEIERVFSRIDSDDAVKAVVVTGAGKAFIAGADIKMLQAVKTAKEARELAAIFHKGMNRIASLSKPVIAAIHGYCLGGGLEVALACHIRVAGEKAQFGVPEIKLGVFPGAGGTQRLPRTVGKAKALEMILTGDFVSAQQALALGLVNRVVPQEKVLEEARSLAGQIASKGRISVGSAIKVVMEGLEGDLQRGLDLEADYFSKLFETADMREGMAAFLEKREPAFQDR